jgi:hypothetical protein
LIQTVKLARIVRELQIERAQIAERLGEVDCDFDPGPVRTVVLERVKQMRVAFDGFELSPGRGTSRRRRGSHGDSHVW